MIIYIRCVLCIVDSAFGMHVDWAIAVGGSECYMCGVPQWYDVSGGRL